MKIKKHTQYRKLFIIIIETDGAYSQRPGGTFGRDVRAGRTLVRVGRSFGQDGPEVRKMGRTFGRDVRAGHSGGTCSGQT